MAVLGPTRRPYTVNNLAVTDLQRIMTPLFVPLNMFAVVVPYLFSVLFVLENYYCLVHQLSEMKPFMPIRLYKRHDMSLKKNPLVLLR